MNFIVSSPLHLEHSAQSSSPFERERMKANDVLRQIRAQMANNPAYAPSLFLSQKYRDAHEAGIQDQFQYGIKVAKDWKSALQGGSNPVNLRYGNTKNSWVDLAASTIGLATPFADQQGLIDRKRFLQLFDPQGHLSQKKLNRLMCLVDKVDGVENSKSNGKPVVSILDVMPLIEFFDRGGGNALPDFRITVQERLSALTQIRQQLSPRKWHHWNRFIQSLQSAYKAMICPLAQPEVASH